MARKDVFGVEVEVGDIVLSAPKGGGYKDVEVGQVSGVFESGRVSIKIPTSIPTYAYEEGAPDVEVPCYGYLFNEDGTPKMVERRNYSGGIYMSQEWGPTTRMSRDYTVVRREWKWMRKQAADINLIVLKKRGQDARTLDEVFGMNELGKAVMMDYDAPVPDMGENAS